MKRPPVDTINWTVSLAARELGIDRTTLNRKLKAAGVDTGKGRTLSTRQLFEAVAGVNGDSLSIAKEKLRKVKEEADRLELENRKTRGELIPVDDVRERLEKIFGAIRSAVLASPHLDPDTKDQAILELAAVKNIVREGES